MNDSSDPQAVQNQQSADLDSSSKPSPGNSPCPIVGIGASAGGLEALSTFLQCLPKTTGLAFVIVQHLDPTHKSSLAALLARATEMPVSQVKNGDVVERDHVYVVPPNSIMSVEEGVLGVTPRQESRGLHMPVDHFFRYLAKNHKNRTIGMIFSGTGSDGALGLKEIKEAGGITFAQSEKSAKFAGMPHSAIATGSVDFILTVEEIARELLRIANHPYLISAGTAKDEDLPNAATPSFDQLSLIFRLLRRTTGIDFTAYKVTTLLRRITRRMTLKRIETLEEYESYLRKNPDEIRTLYHDLLIKVTGFFRDPDTFEAFQRTVIPQIVKDHEPGTAIRIWVPGCATGEEVYSIAICFLEAMGESSMDPMIKIFATDIDDEALHTARTGIYLPNISIDVSAERLRRFFTSVDSNYRVKNSIRELCTFAKHDLCQDPPFSNLDLVSCRNLLIYFQPQLQKRILPLFHYALRAEGFLTLGTAETIGGFSDLFVQADKKQKIYTRRSGPLHTYVDYTPRARRWKEVEADAFADPSNKSMRPEVDVYKEADRMLLHDYAPAGVLVNENLDILQFRGDTSRYLMPFPGKASLNLRQMAREGLLMQVTTTIDEAKRSGQTSRRERIRLSYDGKSIDLSIKVIPLKLLSSLPHYVVLFEESGPPSRREANATGTSAPWSRWFSGVLSLFRSTQVAPQEKEDPENRQLRQELDATRRYLQSTVENQDATNEELKSANEEVLSSNEELQSTNEELETAKEELQSSNEELSTINEEMAHQNRELVLVNNDLNNIFSSASLPVLMLDKNLLIRRFTRMAQEILNVIPTDIGRPLADLQINFQIPDLEALLKTVMDTCRSQEMEIQDTKGRWYSMRIQPYQTGENRVAGVILFFIDITSLKGVEKLHRSLEELQTARDYSAGIVDTVRQPLLMLDDTLRVISANPAYFQTFQASKEETENQVLYSLENGQWNIPELKTLLNETLSKNSDFQNFRVERTFPRIGARTMLLNGKRISLHGAGSRMILLAIEDITERRVAEDQIKSTLAEKEILLKEVHHRVKNNLQIMSSLLKLGSDAEQSDNVRAFVSDSQDRIQAIALVHEQLYNANNLSSIPLRSYFQSLIDQLLRSYQGAKNADVVIQGDITVGVDAAILVGLIFNELVTNAMKHAFPKGKKGTIHVELRSESDKEALLEIRDNGIGLPRELDIEKSSSVGLSLVRQLVKQVKGRLEVERGSAGTGFTIRFPASQKGPPAP